MLPKTLLKIIEYYERCENSEKAFIKAVLDCPITGTIKVGLLNYKEAERFINFFDNFMDDFIQYDSNGNVLRELAPELENLYLNVVKSFDEASK